MKRRAGLLSMVLVLTVGLGGSVRPAVPSDQAATREASPPSKPAEKRERARDRVVHIEEGIIRDIPAVPRLCDSMNIRKDKVDIGDCKLYCEQEGQGTPLVLLHGGPGSTHGDFHPWLSQAKDFARVIYYDQRGCGLSDYQPGKGYSVDQAVDDLDHLRQALGIDQWVVLGHSYGGLLAQCYVLKYPQNVKGLILLCASTGLHGEGLPSRQYEFISAEERQKMAQIRKTSGLSTAQLIYNNFLNGDWKRQSYCKPTREQIAQIALYGWVQDKNFNSIMSQSANAVNLEGAFAQCPIPTLQLEGKWDMSWNTDKPERLHQNHPRARLVLFEASAHSPFEDEPDQFFRILKDYLGTLPRVEGAAVKQWKDDLAKRPKKKLEVKSAFLQTPVDPREHEMVQSLEDMKGKVLQGHENHDLSTPAQAFLTLLSAFYHQDSNTVMQVLPFAHRLPQLLAPELRLKLLEGMGKTTVCRIEVKDQPPQESDLAAIYTTDSPDKKINQVFMFGYIQGAWRFLGSDSGLVNGWRARAEADETQTRSILQQASPKSR
jgi:proline iminopeptidase